MDKVQEILAKVNELHGEVDALRVLVEGYAARAAQLQPAVEQLAKTEAAITEKNAELGRLVAAVASAQADYEKMKAHFETRPL